MPARSRRMTAHNQLIVWPNETHSAGDLSVRMASVAEPSDAPFPAAPFPRIPRAAAASVSRRSRPRQALVRWRVDAAPRDVGNRDHDQHGEHDRHSPVAKPQTA
jgi:hypothetical protein